MGDVLHDGRICGPSGLHRACCSCEQEKKNTSFGLVLLLIMIQQHSNMKVIKSNDNSSAKNGKEQKQTRREPVKPWFSVQ